MSDEKESKTINISPLPSCVDDTVKEALKPAAKGIGTLLGDLLSMATNGIHFKAEKARIQQEHDLEVFKASVALRKESVDRNKRARRPQATRGGRSPQGERG